MQARFSFFTRVENMAFRKQVLAELGTGPLISVELDSLAKIHDCDIDYLYSNILYVKDLSLVHRTNPLLDKTWRQAI